MINITDIKELRIFPPLVMARFGSSSEPLENYTLEINPEDPTGFRKITPAPSFIINDEDGSIQSVTNPNPDTDTVQFRDNEGRIKPLCPFLELWVRFTDDGPFVPLTIDYLQELNLTAYDLKWKVRVANLKPFRRTGDPDDKVEADSGQISDHDNHELHGWASNFKPGKSIYLGSVRYIKPTDDFPEIRMRFMPASGKVFGPRDTDPFTNDDVYGGFTAAPSPTGGYPGEWDRYFQGRDGTHLVTAPGDIYQGQLIGDLKLSDGYFDDTCDGVIEVSLAVGGQNLSAYARIVSTLPDFAPDSFIVRTIKDDLEQMALGVEIAAPETDEEKQVNKNAVIDTLRRSLETVRLMNTMVQNGDQYNFPALFSGTAFTISADGLTLTDNSQNWTPDQWADKKLVVKLPDTPVQVLPIASNTATEITVTRPINFADGAIYGIFERIGGVEVNGNNNPAQETGTGRVFEPVYPTDRGFSQYPFVVENHITALNRLLTSTELDGYFPVFYFNKMRPADEFFRLENRDRRKMPAMMRGSEGLELTLTKRQLRKIEIGVDFQADADPAFIDPIAEEANQVADEALNDPVKIASSIRLMKKDIRAKGK